jgi:NAD-dependent deacetylase
MFQRDPALTWKYIHQIERACRGASFNKGHRVIAQFESMMPRTWVLTQNVDGFHRKAGSSNVIDIHGDVHRLDCTRCEHSWVVEDYVDIEIPPSCGKCASMVRPRVVLFGEMLPTDKVQTLRQQLEIGFDAVVSIGTSSVFPYIASPVIEASAAGKFTVEINPEKTEVSAFVDEKIAHPAAQTLTKIWETLSKS